MTRRRARWLLVVGLSPLLIGFGVLVVVVLSADDVAARQALLAKFMWPTMGLFATILAVAAALHQVGVARAVRRRARWLRRRYRGHYFSPQDLQALRGHAPHLATLIADTQHQRRRLTGSRAWRQRWLPTTLTDHDLDIQEWNTITTVKAITASMTALRQACAHPELADTIHDHQTDITTATRALRAGLADLTALADAATTIDQTITAAETQHTRQQQHDQIAQHLTATRTALTTASGSHHPSIADDAAAATTAAQFTATHLNPQR
jgi:hypothetical protein